MRRRGVKVLGGVLVLALLYIAVGLVVVIATTQMGYVWTFVRSPSMSPTLIPGDLVLATRASLANIHKGDIVVFWYQGLTIHRVVGFKHANGATYVVTKGDANSFCEEWPASYLCFKVVEFHGVPVKLPMMGFLMWFVKDVRSFGSHHY